MKWIVYNSLISGLDQRLRGKEAFFLTNHLSDFNIYEDPIKMIRKTPARNLNKNIEFYIQDPLVNLTGMLGETLDLLT